jgi:NAD(P)-dependent dehydrogenase (short-subunit alcohol dehydrogenase family)
VSAVEGLAGKVAVVTGAARPPGLGRATALRLAAEGAHVVCVDTLPTHAHAIDESNTIAPGSLEQVAREVRARGRRALAIEADLADTGAIADVIDRAVGELGRVDICAHLGGGTGPRLATGPLLDIDEAAWDRCIATNLVSPWLVARACAAQMVRQGDGGSLTLLSSFAARTTPERYGAFSAARAGVVRLVEVLALELAGTGIRANAVLPLGVAPHAQPNPGLDDLRKAEGGSLDAWVQRHIPLNRLQEADETAAVFAFLASDEASFVSGQAISVSGGAVR